MRGLLQRKKAGGLMESTVALGAAQIRVARPTDKLDKVVRYYRDRLGFKFVESFENHDSYDGATLAFPDRPDRL